ncbi:hypothetical protein EV182_002152 [Spiromyces aspiralis]|uniref:Uncharacterized protein n=1 Tax=Spiromyces aspiralis TaxID=68401 RepID=A0ACC1HF71_9FUNG|nr:hypothetical protein EV182_002152 [Spiromyces aspiralis]
MGAHIWMFCIALATEVLVVFKYSKGEFPKPFPPKVIAFWVGVASLITTYATWQFWIRPCIVSAALNSVKKRQGPITSKEVAADDEREQPLLLKRSL